MMLRFSNDRKPLNNTGFIEIEVCCFSDKSEGGQSRAGVLILSLQSCRLFLAHCSSLPRMWSTASRWKHLCFRRKKGGRNKDDEANNTHQVFLKEGSQKLLRWLFYLYPIDRTQSCEHIATGKPGKCSLYIWWSCAPLWTKGRLTIEGQVSASGILRKVSAIGTNS